MSPELLNVMEVANLLQLHAMTVYRLVKDGKLPGFKVGGRWRFHRSALEDWMVDRAQIARLEAENRNIGLKGS
jgi:excisionase family DNA binding protein